MYQNCLKNLDEEIGVEVKAKILLHSLLEEDNHFNTMLLYKKSMIVFKDVSIALTDLEIQNKHRLKLWWANDGWWK